MDIDDQAKLIVDAIIADLNDRDILHGLSSATMKDIVDSWATIVGDILEETL